MGSTSSQYVELHLQPPTAPGYCHMMDLKVIWSWNEAVRMILTQCGCGICIKRRWVNTERWRGCVYSEGQLKREGPEEPREFLFLYLQPSMVGSDSRGIVLLSYCEYRLSSVVLISLVAVTPLHTVLSEFTLISLPNNVFFTFLGFAFCSLFSL